MQIYNMIPNARYKPICIFEIYMKGFGNVLRAARVLSHSIFFIAFAINV